MPCDQKQTQNPKKKIIKKKFLCLKAKQNTEISNEEPERSDSEFDHPEEQEKAESNASRRGRHFGKVEASGNTGCEKLVPAVLKFRNIECHIIKYILTSIVRSLQ